MVVLPEEEGPAIRMIEAPPCFLRSRISSAIRPISLLCMASATLISSVDSWLSTARFSSPTDDTRITRLKSRCSVKALNIFSCTSGLAGMSGCLESGPSSSMPSCHGMRLKVPMLAVEGARGP